MMIQITRWSCGEKSKFLAATMGSNGHRITTLPLLLAFTITLSLTELAENNAAKLTYCPLISTASLYL